MAPGVRICSGKRSSLLLLGSLTPQVHSLLSSLLMRFPLALTTKIAAYIIGNKLRGTEKFATVLQLEPLHTCNLTCTGCGRIREYSTSLKDMMTLEDCLGAAEECKAPMVSICGGELRSISCVSQQSRNRCRHGGLAEAGSLRIPRDDDAEGSRAPSDPREPRV